MSTAPTPPDWVSGEVISETKLDSISTAISFLRNPPRAALSRSSNLSIANNTNTAVTWNAEDVDTVNGHSTVTNTSRYTVQYDGTYLCHAVLPYINTSSAYKGAVWLRVNGSGSIEYEGNEIQKPTNDITISLLVTAEISLVTGDYVEVFTWQNSGSALSIDASQHGGPRFYLRWVSA